MKKVILFLSVIFVLFCSACGSPQNISSAEAISSTEITYEVSPEQSIVGSVVESKNTENITSSVEEYTSSEEPAVQDPELVEVVFPSNLAESIAENDLDELCETAGYASAEKLEDGSLILTMTEERRDQLFRDSTISSINGAAQTYIEKGTAGLESVEFDYGRQALSMFVSPGSYEVGGTNALMLRIIPYQTIRVAASVQGQLAWTVSIYDSESGELLDQYEESYSPEQSSSGNDEKLDYMVSIIDGVLKDSCGENYSLTINGNTISIGIWANGTALDSVMAKSGNQDSINSWNDMVDSMLTMEEGIKSLFKSAEYDDYKITLNVLNDLNKNNVLLIISDGTVVYDTVNGIDIIGIG